MKKTIFAIICCLCSITTLAQRKIIPVNWDNIKKEVNDNADNVKKQIARLSAQEIDTTMTYEERILAFYGQSLFTSLGVARQVKDVSKSYNNGDFEEALEQADSVLAVNPLNIKALRLAAYSISKLLNNQKECKYTLNDGQILFNRMMRCLNTIAITGDGTKKAPFYVTSIDDEYEFMYTYLELEGIDRQSLIGTCDVFDLSSKSEYYSLPKISFECSRVLEMECEMFINE